MSLCIRKFFSGKEEVGLVFDVLEVEEHTYLKKKLDCIMIQTPKQLRTYGYYDISPKFEALIDFLGSQDVSDFTGLVFVQTRAEVAVISYILSVHPKTCKFSIGTFIGISGYPGRKNKVSELADAKDQKTTLDDLREGRKNLIITTNALEEGIDVIACNVVSRF